MIPSPNPLADHAQNASGQRLLAHPAADGDHVGIPAHGLDLPIELVRQPVVVGVEKRHELAVSLRKALVSGFRESDVRPRKRHQARVVNRPNDPQRAVCRPVVDDDDLEVLVGLGDDTFDGLGNELLCIEGWDDDTHQREFGRPGKTVAGRLHRTRGRGSHRSRGYTLPQLSGPAANATCLAKLLRVKIAVAGTGHVGLPTSVALSRLGHDVAGYDTDEEKIRQLSSGIVPFVEPGLGDALETELRSGRLRFTTSPRDAIAEKEVVFVCVSTPAEDGRVVLEAIERCARDIARYATRDVVVAEKSTVPAGTSERLEMLLAGRRDDVTFDVVSNPEFMREGSALTDALHPTRILVGSDSQRGFEVMRRVYEPLLRHGHRVIETNAGTAEMAKYACNAFLALKISYANSLARLCELMGGDVTIVTDVMGADPRIGEAFLAPGLGFGGGCLPKDLDAFQRLAQDFGYDFPLLHEVDRLNEEALSAALDKIETAIGDVNGKRIALLGLAYKPGTDDVRFAPALGLAQRLHARGAQIAAYDPHAMANAKAEMSSLELSADPYAAATGADCLVICTEWEEFQHLDLVELGRVMVSPVVVDGRNVLNPEDAKRARVAYYPTGSAPSLPPMTE